MDALKGKVALVTGAGKGIGAAIARELADYQANLVLNYAHSKEATEALCEELQQRHPEIDIITSKADVSDLDQVTAMMDEAWKRFGRIDYLINNAGITRDKTFRKLTVDDWKEVIDTNLTGVFNCIHAAMPHLIEQGNGSVINISSIVAQMGNFGQANYAAAKGGLFSFSKTLALEWARYNISVNCVAPGFIETDMLSKVPEEYKELILEKIPLHRFGRPEEVAKAVRFLCVDGDYITGQVIAINGGMYM